MSEAQEESASLMSTTPTTEGSDPALPGSANQSPPSSSPRASSPDEAPPEPTLSLDAPSHEGHSETSSDSLSSVAEPDSPKDPSTTSSPPSKRSSLPRVIPTSAPASPPPEDPAPSPPTSPRSGSLSPPLSSEEAPSPLSVAQESQSPEGDSNDTSIQVVLYSSLGSAPLKTWEAHAHTEGQTFLVEAAELTQLAITQLGFLLPCPLTPLDPTLPLYRMVEHADPSDSRNQVWICPLQQQIRVLLPGGDTRAFVVSLEDRVRDLLKQCTQAVQGKTETVPQDVSHKTEGEEEMPGDSPAPDALEEGNDEENDFRLFLPSLSIWLVADRYLTFYRLAPSEVLELRPRPIYLHICLPHIRQCTVICCDAATRAEQVVQALQSNPHYWHGHAPPSTGLFLLRGESNLRLLREAQTQQLGKRFHCSDDLLPPGPWHEGEEEERELLLRLHPTRAHEVGDLLEHAGRYQVVHVHPLDVAEDAEGEGDLAWGEGEWLSPTACMADRSPQDYLLLQINPTWDEWNSTQADQFLTLYYPEGRTLKRRKYEFDTTVEEMTDLMTRTLKLPTSHGKSPSYRLMYPGVDSASSQPLPPTACLSTLPVHRDFPLYLELAPSVSSQRSGDAQLGTKFQVDVLLSSSSSPPSLAPISAVRSGLSEPPPHTVSVHCDLDTLVKDIKRQACKACQLGCVRGANLFLLRKNEKEPLALRDENAMSSYALSDTKLILACQISRAPVSLHTVQLPVQGQSSESSSGGLRTPQPGFAKVNYHRRQRGTHTMTFHGQQELGSVLADVTSQVQARWAESRDEDSPLESPPVAYEAFLQHSSSDLPPTVLFSSGTSLSQYALPALPLTPVPPTEMEVLQQSQPYHLTVRLDFSESDEQFSLSRWSEEEESGPGFLRVSYHALSTVQDLLDLIATRFHAQHPDGLSLEEITDSLALHQPLVSSISSSSSSSSPTNGSWWRPARLVRSYRPQEKGDVVCTRCPFVVRTVLHLTSGESEKGRSLLPSLQPRDQAPSLAVRTLRMSSILATPRQLVERLFQQVERGSESLQRYYGVYVPNEERWLDMDLSFLANQLGSDDQVLEVKIEPSAMRVVYYEPRCVPGENPPTASLQVDVDYTLTLTELIFSQLLGSLSCSRRDLLEVRLLAEGQEGDEGRLLKLSDSLAMQGVHPGEHTLHIRCVEEGGREANPARLEEETNIWEPGQEGDLVMDPVDGKARVKAGTLNRLVEYLTSKSVEDRQFVQVFFLTYPMFVSSETLFHKFLQRFQVPMPVDVDAALFTSQTKRPIQFRVVNTMRNWIERCGSTLDEDLHHALDVFISNGLEAEGLTHLAGILRSSLSKVGSGSARDVRVHAFVPAPMVRIPKTDLMSMKFIDFDDEEIARQLSLIAQKLYSAIQPSEFLNQAWTKAKYHHRCENLLAAIDRFNLESQWVATMIINVSSTKARAKVVTKFINIAKHLMALQNYSSVMAFFAALNTAAVSRLKWTMKEVPRKAQETLAEMERFLSNEMNYRAYRSAISQVQSTACVPYLGVHLSDLIFIEEGNATYLEDGALINFEACRLIGQVISLLKSLQETPYSLSPVPELALLLRKLPVMGDKHLYQLSLKREPRGQVPPDMVDTAGSWDKKLRHLATTNTKSASH